MTRIYNNVQPTEVKKGDIKVLQHQQKEKKKQTKITANIKQTINNYNGNFKIVGKM